MQRDNCTSMVTVALFETMKLQSQAARASAGEWVKSVGFSSAVKRNGTVLAVGPGDSREKQVTRRQNPLVSHTQNLDFEKT